MCWQWKSDFDLPMKKANALYCSLRQRWWKIGSRFIITGAGTPGRPAWTCFVWSHALPIPVFRVKTTQPRINLFFFLFFLVIKTMSVNLSIGLCCVISVIVCKCCGLSVAMPMANSPTSSLQYNLFNHSTDAQNQWKIIHNSGIYLIEKYILHSAPLFSFSNSRSAKSKTWLRAVALLQTWHLNAMRQHLNAMRMTFMWIHVV